MKKTKNKNERISNKRKTRDIFRKMIKSKPTEATTFTIDVDTAYDETGMPN